MGAYSFAIGHHCCHVWILGELFEHVGPYTVLFPACEALEDAVPLAIAVWQFTLLGACAQNPVNCLNETATLLLSPCVGTRVSLQKRVKFLPLTVGDFSCRHPAIVANVSEFIKCQRPLALAGDEYDSFLVFLLLLFQPFCSHWRLTQDAQFIPVSESEYASKPIGFPALFLHQFKGLFGTDFIVAIHGADFYAGRWLGEDFAGQGVAYGGGPAFEVSYGFFDGGVHCGQELICGGPLFQVNFRTLQERFNLVEVILGVAGEFLKAEATSAGIGEHECGGRVGTEGCAAFGGCKSLLDEGFGPVAISVGGDSGGGVEDGQITVSAGDVHGGHFGFFAVNLFRFFICEAVDLGQCPDAVAHGVELSGRDFTFPHLGQTLAQLLDDTFVWFG